MSATPSRLSEAFGHLMDAKAAALGVREYVLLDGQKVEALVSEITADDVLVMGGIGHAGGFRCSIAWRELAAAPEKFTAIEVRGHTMQVLSSNEINGTTYEITAGDPASEDS